MKLLVKFITLLTKTKQIYESNDEIEENLSFQFGIQNDLYYNLFHSYTEGKKS